MAIDVHLPVKTESEFNAVLPIDIYANEKGRISNENQRIANENERIRKENEREAEYTDLKNNVNLNTQARHTHNNFSFLENLSQNSIIQELSSPVRIWNLNDGIYKLPSDCYIYYKGASDLTSLKVSSTSFLYIVHSANSRKEFLLISSIRANPIKTYYGYSSSSSGDIFFINLDHIVTYENFEDYIVNNLDYAYNDSYYGLSAYMGYYLNQIKANKNELPTKLSDLTNDCRFITNAVNDLINYYKKSETYTREEVNQRISAIPKFAIEVVEQLPSSNISPTTIYLLVTGEESQNLYTEYIYVNNAWEKLGTQRVDLTGYATEDWVSLQIANFLTQSQIQTLINTSIAGKEDKSNKVTTIDTTTPSATKYPSESAVVTYVSGIVGNIESILEELDIGGGVE